MTRPKPANISYFHIPYKKEHWANPELQVHASEESIKLEIKGVPHEQDIRYQHSNGDVYNPAWMKSYASPFQGRLLRDDHVVLSSQFVERVEQAGLYFPYSSFHPILLPDGGSGWVSLRSKIQNGFNHLIGVIGWDSLDRLMRAQNTLALKPFEAIFDDILDTLEESESVLASAACYKLTSQHLGYYVDASKTNTAEFKSKFGHDAVERFIVERCWVKQSQD